MMNNMLCFVSDDGIYFSDFSQTVLASERLRQSWEALNRRRLRQAVVWFDKQKLYVSLPNGISNQNNTVLVFDTIRQAWFTINGWNVSSVAVWSEAGRQVVLLGHSDTGQVSEMDSGQNNMGTAIESVWHSKHFDGGAPDTLKRYRHTTVNVISDIQPAVLELSYIIDGGPPSAAVSLMIPASPDRRTEVVQINPATVGVHYARSIGYRLRQNTLNAQIGIRSLSQVFYPTRDLPTIRS